MNFALKKAIYTNLFYKTNHYILLKIKTILGTLLLSPHHLLLPVSFNTFGCLKALFYNILGLWNINSKVPKGSFQNAIVTGGGPR